MEGMGLLSLPCMNPGAHRGPGSAQGLVCTPATTHGAFCELHTVQEEVLATSGCFGT